MTKITNLTQLSIPVISRLQDYIREQGYRVLIHFELEGCYQKPDNTQLDYQQVNKHLRAQHIDGEVVAEYWSKQWEYVSLFNGQSPLKEAHNLRLAMDLLPQLFSAQGVSKTLIKPVVWAGDNSRLASGSGHIFSTDKRAVHIPNAIQMNISVQDLQGNNLMVASGLAERLQQTLLQTSLGCCLIYLPEEEAFERLALKKKYGLAAELCSPVDISGGHQGSVALYRDKGKHNQKMGVEPLIYDDKSNVVVSQDNWQKTARIEHRLGASSMCYSPYLNVIYALLNVVDTIDGQQGGKPIAHGHYGELPSSLYDQKDSLGAISLFKSNHWFTKAIDNVMASTDKQQQVLESPSIGQQIQCEYVKQFQRSELVF
ncbi:MAG: hypothetical protein ACPG52_11070 [Cognaticolwellia sp.]